MVENTRPISRMNPKGWLWRMRLCAHLWYAATFQSTEVCWHEMGLFKDCLPMRAVAGTRGGIAAAIAVVQRLQRVDRRPLAPLHLYNLYNTEISSGSEPVT